MLVYTNLRRQHPEQPSATSIQGVTAMKSESVIWRWALIAAMSTIAIAIFSAATPIASAIQSSFAPEPSKIATVDLGRLLDGLEEKQVAEGLLAEFAQEEKVKVDALKLASDDARADLEAASEATRDELRREALSREANYRVQVQVTNALIEQRISQIQIEFFNTLIEEVSLYAERIGYDLVVTDDRGLTIPPNLGGPELENAILSRRVVYVREATDITDDLITELNNRYRTQTQGR